MGKSRGRPRCEFDDLELQRIHDFGMAHMSYERMADELNIGLATVSDRMNDETSDFSKAYKKGLEKLKHSIRAKQIEVALSGNPTMLIWEGKTLLGQKDSTDINHSGKVGSDVQVVVVKLPDNGT